MYLLFDIGGTHSRFAVSQDHQTLSEVKTIPTPQSFTEALEVYKQLISELIRDEKITAACGGIPGPLDQLKTMMINSPHLPQWIEKPFKDSLQEILDAPVFLENDASLAGLGEAVFGAGKDCEIVAYLTISTGVGGVRIVKKAIDQSSQGFEPGHQIIDFEAKTTLEDLISGTALQEKYNLPPEEISDQSIWEEITKVLAVGLNNTAVYWSPDMIVLGGAVSKSLPLDILENYFNEYSTIFPTLPKLAKSQKVDQSGLFGALAYLNQKNT